MNSYNFLLSTREQRTSFHFKFKFCFSAMAKKILLLICRITYQDFMYLQMCYEIKASPISQTDIKDQHYLYQPRQDLNTLQHYLFSCFCPHVQNQIKPNSTDSSYSACHLQAINAIKMIKTLKRIKMIKIIKMSPMIKMIKNQQGDQDDQDDQDDQNY